MTTKLCDFCGKEIPANSKICPYCNKALEEKVFTYIGENKPKSDSANGLDVSRYISEQKTKQADNYFNSNIYSFSEQEIERRFERKTLVYDEEEQEERENQSEKYRMQREYIPQKQRKKNQKNKRKKRKHKSLTALLLIVLLIIAVIIGLIVVKPFSSGKSDEEVTTTIKATTTQATTTTETTTETTTIGTTPETYSAQSVDLDGYLGLSFSSFSNDFGTQIKDSTSDEFYGGSTYYYDGMTISTDSNGKIASMTVDYTTVDNKDTYRFKDITYYSFYDHVIDELGEPDLDQMSDKNEPCIAYTLDIGSKLSIKFNFDDNKKVCGYKIFYAD